MLRALRVGQRWCICITLVVLAVAFLPQADLRACPNCREAVQSTAVGDGLNYSILGMMSMPFVLVGSVAIVVLRTQRRTRAADSDTPDTTDPAIWN